MYGDKKNVSHGREILREATSAHEPMPGEVRMNEFLDAESQRQQISPAAIVYRIRRGYYPDIRIRRVNRAVSFVRFVEPK